MIKDLNKDTFKDDIQKENVLLKFYSKTCGPCKMLGFMLKDLDKTYGDKLDIINIDFEENKDLVDQYGVNGYPTIVMLKNGQETSRKEGLQQKPALDKLFKEATL